MGLWIDWNNDGIFGSGEFYAFSGLTAGSLNTVQLTVPGSSVYTVGTPVNVRVRAFDPASLPGGSLDGGDYVGPAANGEVEDYQWNFGPTAISLASLSVGVDGLPFWLVGLSLVLLLGVGVLLWYRRRHLILKPARQRKV